MRVIRLHAAGIVRPNVVSETLLSQRIFFFLINGLLGKPVVAPATEHPQLAYSDLRRQ